MFKPNDDDVYAVRKADCGHFELGRSDADGNVSTVMHDDAEAVTLALALIMLRWAEHDAAEKLDVDRALFEAGPTRIHGAEEIKPSAVVAGAMGKPIRGA